MRKNRPIPPYHQWRHGTTSCYSNNGCRCDECRAAKSIEQKKRTKIFRGLPQTTLICRSGSIVYTRSPRVNFRNTADDFWRFVKKSDGCWLWTGTFRKRYGFFSIGGKEIAAHRFSYELHNGPIARGLWVCHKCDNPPCVNPSHLFVGTARDNSHDCLKKGRIGRHPKLTWDQVHLIRRLYPAITQRKLADQFGISQSQVGAIVRHRFWKEAAL